MNASEMTNEELAKLISDGCGTSFMGHAIREAAARLRNVTVRTDNSAVIAELQRRLKVAEDALRNSPCGVIYQLGLVDDEGNDYCGCAVKFTEEENEKMPRVGMGDRFVVVPYNAIAAIREEGGCDAV